MSCPHYTETEKQIGDLTLLVCRDCGARLAADAEIIESEPLADDSPPEQLAALLALAAAQSPAEIQAVIDSAMSLGILEEWHGAEGIESARIERVDGELVLIEGIPGD